MTCQRLRDVLFSLSWHKKDTWKRYLQLLLLWRKHFLKVKIGSFKVVFRLKSLSIRITRAYLREPLKAIFSWLFFSSLKQKVDSRFSRRRVSSRLQLQYVVEAHGYGIIMSHFEKFFNSNFYSASGLCVWVWVSRVPINVRLSEFSFVFF